MKSSKSVLVAGAVWQIIRFSAIGIIVIVYLNPVFSPGKSLLLLWLASSQLGLSAAFFFLAVDPARYIQYRSFALFAKTLDIVPGLTLLCLQAAGLFFRLGTPLFTLVPLIDQVTEGRLDTSVLFYYVLIVIIVIDLIFLMFLISFKYQQQDKTKAVHENLPEIEETHIEVE